MNPLGSLLELTHALLSKRTDVVFALGASFIVALLIVPLPTVVLDVLIAVNIGAATTLLVVALMARRALQISTFPSLLLLSTLFRLGLNVSTTRSILAHAKGGAVVEAFGKFVLQGDIVVGAVIFLVICIVQFLVIAKGAERVAEVGARFTLDAMPGKQMSIDASLRAGALTEEEAQLKRDELGRQCQLFGNMDGAMKFVKGDAIAGMIITALNLAAGFVIGVLRFHMPMDGALQTYSVLSVGDGLVSQIPALLVTIAAGIIVTRVEGTDERSNLGTDFKLEVLGQPKVLYISAALMLILALIPGLPFMPFVCMASLLAGLAYTPGFIANMKAQRPQTHPQKVAEKKVKQLEKKKKKAEEPAPWVAPITLEIGAALSNKLGFNIDGGNEEDIDLLRSLIPQLREALFEETGVQFPGVRVRTFATSAPRNGFVIIIKDVPVFEQEIDPSKLLALTPPARLSRLGVQAEETRHPIGGEIVALIDPADRRVVESAGVQIWSPSGVVALHLGGTLRQEAKAFIGIQEVTKMVRRLEKTYPDLVSEVIPKIVSSTQLAEVLRRLVDEGVCIRDFKTIVEIIAEHGGFESDPVALSELVRGGLSKQIAHRYSGLSNRLPVVLLDPVIEDTIEGGIQQTRRGSVLSLDPEIARSIVLSVAHALSPVMNRGMPPVILTSSRVRRLVRKIIELDLPDVPVLAFEELPAKLVIQPMGRATIS